MRIPTGRLFSLLTKAMWAIGLIGPIGRDAGAETLPAREAVAVSASAQASEAGADIMRQGGNALDAAAAIGFVLAVTHPQAGNLGGGGFLVARLASGETLSLDFREQAPGGASRDMYLDSQGKVREGLSLYSPLASGVPGSVAGLLRAWEDHGSGNVSRKRLLEPAIRLARRGFPISAGLARALNREKERFSRDPGASKIFIRGDGRPWRGGDRLVQRDLARTLRRIARRGRTGFYSGRTAELLARQMARTGGLITREDLAAYQSKYRDPVIGTFRGYEVISMGPPSSGGVLLVQMLNMLEPSPLKTLGWNSAAYVHLLTEVQRRAYSDRAEHLGDLDFWKVPMAMLLAKDYALSRAATIDPDRATPSAEVRAGALTVHESPETTHYSVVDAHGNAVAVTTTLNAGFGSGIVVRGAGFLLNNEMDDFSIKPGTSNLYGLVGNEANAIAPRKRMLSSMTPTLVVKDGRTVLVVGTPGGATIITTVLQILLNVLVHGMDIGEAVAAPRHHSQWLPDRIVYEADGLPDETRQALGAMGHRMSPYPGGAIGRANCIHIAGGLRYGAPDPRGENFAAGD